MRYKRIIAIILIAVAVIMHIPLVSYALDIGFEPNTQTIRLTTIATNATTPVTYSVEGWTIAFTGESGRKYAVRLKLKNTSSTPLPGNKTEYVYEIPIASATDPNNVLDRCKATYGDHEDFIKFFSKDKHVKLYALIVIKNNGVPEGSLNYDGTTTGKVYDLYAGDLDALKKARAWLDLTTFDGNYIRDCFIPAVDVPKEDIAPPTAKITHKGVEVSSLSVSEGEPIDISGANSKFPGYATEKLYTWQYRTKGSSTWTTLVTKGIDKVVPPLPNLKVGKYEVKLHVDYNMGKNKYEFKESEHPETSTTMELEIKPNANKAYVIATGDIEPDKIVSQEDVDNNVPIPVNVGVTGKLMDYPDISRISKWTLHLRKDPQGPDDQYQKVEYTTNLKDTASATCEFTIPAGLLKNSDSYTQPFVVSAWATVDGKVIKSDPVYCYIKLYKEGAAPYVKATPSIEPDKKISQEDVDKNVLIPVEVGVTGVLKNLSDISKISKWTLHLRKEPQGEDDQYQKVEFTTNLRASAHTICDFTIPAGVLKNSDRYTQKFAVSAWATVDGKVIKSDTEYCSITIYKVGVPPPDPNPDPPEVNEPPVAVITSPSYVKAGELVNISGTRSYDPDGTIVDYYWEIQDKPNAISGSSGYYTFPYIGVYNVTLVVTDDDGATGQTEKTITVLPPSPVALITANGKFKENRIVNIDGTHSIGTPQYPIDWSKAEWSITPVSDTGATDNIWVVTSLDANGMPIGNKYSAGSIDGGPLHKIVFKDAGEYDISLTVYNTAGMSGSRTYRLEIKEDLPPVVNASVYPTERLYNADGTLCETTIIRVEHTKDSGTTPVMFEVSRYTYNGCLDRINEFFGVNPITEAKISEFLSANPDIKRVTTSTPLFAKLVITDNSYSPDGDFLANRKIWVTYDANNNGVFTDSVDTKTLIQDLSGQENIEKNKVIEYLCSDTVGRYKVEIEVTEGFVP